MSVFELSNGITRMEVLHKEKMEKLLRDFLLAKYKKDDSLPCEVYEGLYLGSIGAAHNKEALLRLKITHILCVANTIEPPYPSDFKYKQIDVRDSADVNMQEHFEGCFSFIDEALHNGGAVLVHCFAGRSRSVTVVVAYLMRTYAFSLAQALELVSSRRPQAAPNLGFLAQLRNFERSLQGASHPSVDTADGSDGCRYKEQFSILDSRFENYGLLVFYL